MNCVTSNTCSTHSNLGQLLRQQEFHHNAWKAAKQLNCERCLGAAALLSVPYQVVGVTLAPPCRVVDLRAAQRGRLTPRSTFEAGITSVVDGTGGLNLCSRDPPDEQY